jgi:hypothetical protein
MVSCVRTRTPLATEPSLSLPLIRHSLCRMLTCHSLSSYYIKRYRSPVENCYPLSFRFELVSACSQLTAAKLITWCAGVLAIQSCSAHLGPGTHYIDQDVTRSTDLVQVMNALLLCHLFKSSAIHPEQAYPLPLHPKLLPISGTALSMEANAPWLDRVLDVFHEQELSIESVGSSG